MNLIFEQLDYVYKICTEWVHEIYLTGEKGPWMQKVWAPLIVYV